MVYTGAGFWDRYHRTRLESGDELDWAGVWIRPFLVPLVTAIDFSAEAIHRKAGEPFKHVWRGVARR